MQNQNNLLLKIILKLTFVVYLRNFYIIQKTCRTGIKKKVIAILDYSFTDILLQELWTYHYPVRKMKGESKALK